MTSNLFILRYGQKKISILKNTFVEFTSLFLMLLGGKNSPQKTTLVVITHKRREWGWQIVD
jgi:hypothetical protein